MSKEIIVGSKIRLTLLLLFCILLSACADKSDLPPLDSLPTRPADAYDEDTRSVYCAVLHASGLDSARGTLVISDEVTDPDLQRFVQSGDLRSDANWIPPEAIEDFLRGVSLPGHHQRLGDLGVLYRVMTDVERNEFDRGKGLDFELLRERNPDVAGVVTLSRVGLSQDRQWALVYVAFNNGTLGGFGRIAIFDRDGKAWHLAATRGGWNS